MDTKTAVAALAILVGASSYDATPSYAKQPLEARVQTTASKDPIRDKIQKDLNSTDDYTRRLSIIRYHNKDVYSPELISAIENAAIEDDSAKRVSLIDHALSIYDSQKQRGRKETPAKKRSYAPLSEEQKQRDIEYFGKILKPLIDELSQVRDLEATKRRNEAWRKEQKRQDHKWYQIFR